MPHNWETAKDQCEALHFILGISIFKNTMTPAYKFGEILKYKLGDDSRYFHTKSALTLGNNDGGQW